MKYVIFIVLFACGTTTNAQVVSKKNKRVSIRRCLDQNCDTIEECFPISNTLGSFTSIHIDTIIDLLNVAHESAVDSLPSHTWAINNWLTSPNNFTTRFKNVARRLDLLSGQRLLLGFRGYSGINSYAKKWPLSGANRTYGISESTTESAEIAFEGAGNGRTQVNETLTLRSDGDIEMGGYTSSRPFSTFPKNFSAWDDDGVMQKYQIQSLIDTVFSNVSGFGDDAEGTTEQNALTAERFINHNDFPVTRVAGERVADNVNGGGLIKKILDLQEGSIVSFNEGIISTDNAGSSTNNFVYMRGFNLTENGTRIDSTKVGWGESWEFHYEPTIGDVFVEKHIILIDLDDIQHRLESYTLDIDNESAYDLYKTVSNWYVKNPTDNGAFVNIAPTGTTGSILKLLGSGSSTGVAFNVDASATNLQITPLGFAGTSRGIFMDQFDLFNLPTITGVNYGAGSAYTYQRNGGLVSQNDNGSFLGTNGFRFSDIEACAIKITAPANYTNNLFEVTDAGEVTISQYPNSRDDGTPTNIFGSGENGELQSYPIAAIPQLYNPDNMPKTSNFSVDPQYNYYLIDQSSAETIDINVDNMIVGKPYRFIGYNGASGDIDFITNIGNFVNDNTNIFDGNVGEYSYEVVRLSEVLFSIVGFMPIY